MPGPAGGTFGLRRDRSDWRPMGQIVSIPVILAVISALPRLVSDRQVEEGENRYDGS
jgi:hypothetical protein